MVQFGPARFKVDGVERGNYQGLPVSGQITDTFGNWPQWRKDRGLGPHGGVDIAASSGTDIRAPADGEAVTNAWFDEFGNYLTIKHDDNTYSGYCHLIERSPIGVGTRVTRGQIIGHVGMTGAATGPHLHWVHTAPGNQHLNRVAGFVNPLDSVTDFAGGPQPTIIAGPLEQGVPEFYLVQAGDTLSALARTWGCTVADIVALNGIADANVINVGQQLRKPKR
ncbi:MAG TPA: peptidoglycan DD-metalloendopeptidase family protein [Dehalococcoidia bacterium]|nr:peptidoglycan DD-metalloendopeptidase family protein [Dehalococcoidia bacterium]